MKNSLLFSVIMLAAMTFTVMSCQKDNYQTNQQSSTTKQAYQPPQVDDLLTYLKDFKQKIQSRCDEETMTLDEAAWHLSSLANYDYGDVRSEFSDFHYDTLYTHIAVSNGTVSLAEMSDTYHRVATAVMLFYQNTDFVDAAPRFIDVAIDDNGMVTVALMTSFRKRDLPFHTWYFYNNTVLDSVLNSLGIPEDTCFTTWDGFINEQKRVLDIVTSDSGHGYSGGEGRLVYIGIRIQSLTSFVEDPYGSPFHQNSRILYYLGTPVSLCYKELAYTADSYAAFSQNYMGTDEVIINWPDLPMEIIYAPLGYTIQTPKIRYGQPLVIIDNPNR